MTEDLRRASVASLGLLVYPGILVDHQIRALIEAETIGVRPWLPSSLQPASLDLRLGPILLIDEVDGHREHDLRESPFTIYQHQFILASTLERIELPPHIVGDLSGKSTLARRGLQVEAAGYVDPGWQGNLTLELYKMGPRPLRLEHGMPLCQITFIELPTACERPYGAPGLGSHYQGSVGVVAGRT